MNTMINRYLITITYLLSVATIGGVIIMTGVA
jgi:hypothetical protein